MKCRCGASLGQLNCDGEAIVRNRGLVFKASGVELVCPKCKGGVPVSGELAKALTDRLRLLLPTDTKRTPL